MNSWLRSVGQNFPLALGLVLTACQTRVPPAEPSPSVEVRQQLESEISLKADREELNELRKAIPEERKQANDELALILQMKGNPNVKPEALRERFQNLVQKRRNAFRVKVTQLRENFNRQERKRKDEFLNKQKSARDEFRGKRADRAKVTQFFANQDRDRQDFFAQERDRRKDFESEISIQSKDFDSYIKEFKF